MNTGMVSPSQMEGAQPDHVLIEGNVFGELFQLLRRKDCRPLGSNITVVCGKPEYVMNRGIGCLMNPHLVVEVLSPSTATLDETQKLLAYTSIRTVREYLVVHSESYAVKLYSRRSAEEIWNVRLYSDLADSASLETCGCVLTLAEIYAGVDPASKNPYLPAFNAL